MAAPCNVLVRIDANGFNGHVRKTTHWRHPFVIHHLAAEKGVLLPLCGLPDANTTKQTVSYHSTSS